MGWVVSSILLPDKDLVDKVLGEVSPASFTNIKDIATKITAAMQAKDPSFALTKMSLGNPGVRAPEELRESGAKYFRNMTSDYDEFAGTQRLREAAAAMFRKYFGLDCKPSNVYVPAGGMNANHLMWTYLTFLAMRGKKPKVFFFEPGYAEVPDQLEELGFRVGEVIRPVSFAEDRKDHLWNIHEAMQRLRRTDKQRPFIIHFATAGNPVPVFFSDNEYRTLGLISEERKAIVVEDGAYFMNLEQGDWKEHRIIENIGLHSRYGMVTVSFSKLLGLAPERCAVTYVPDTLKEHFERVRLRHSGRRIEEQRSRIRHTETHAGLAVQLAAADYLSDDNLGEKIRTLLAPYPLWWDKVYDGLREKGLQIALSNPDGTLAKTLYIPLSMPDRTGVQLFTDFLYAGILTMPLGPSSTSKRTRVEGIRIATPGVMPDKVTGQTGNYERYCERLRYVRF